MTPNPEIISDQKPLLDDVMMKTKPLRVIGKYHSTVVQSLKTVISPGYNFVWPPARSKQCFKISSSNSKLKLSNRCEVV